MIDQYVQEDLETIVNSELPLGELYGSTILVTGATGLVGSLTVKALLQMNACKDAGIRVLAQVRSEEKARRVFREELQGQNTCDDLQHSDCGEGGSVQSASRSSSKENTEEKRKAEACETGLQFLYGDLTEELHVDGPVDYIIHTASPTGSKFFVTHPVETIHIAMQGTDQMLRLAAEKKSKGMVYLSSMEAYGITDPNLPFVTEKDLGYIDNLNVRSCYSEGKRICECLCASYASEYGVPVRIARLAQTFGAGVSPEEGRVFAQFAKSARDKQNIVLHTQGNSVGNYCYTADVVRALLLLLVRGESGEAYTVTNEESNTTIRDMAKMVARELANDEIEVIFDIPEDALTYGYAPDVKMQLSAAKLRSLGWEPQVSLLDSYRRMMGSWEARLTQRTENSCVL